MAGGTAVVEPAVGRRGGTGHVVTDDLFLTDDPDAFMGALVPGDVLLFQGMDFLAGLAQMAERRPVYHSALYVGVERGQHVYVHNVSHLWWRDLADRPPPSSQVRPRPDWGLPVRREATRLTGHLVFEDSTPPRTRYGWASKLVTVGGAGVVRLNEYLERQHAERVPGKRPHGRVHHVQSAYALRWSHPGDGGNQDEELDTGFGLIADANAILSEHTGFPIVELFAASPEAFDRSADGMWHRLRPVVELVVGGFPTGEHTMGTLGDRLRQAVTRLVSDGDDGWKPDSGPQHICAMFVAAVYARHFGARFEVRGFTGFENDRGEPFRTPRDLFDCPQLQPRAMFVRPPQRSRSFAPTSFEVA